MKTLSMRISIGLLAMTLLCIGGCQYQYDYDYTHDVLTTGAGYGAHCTDSEIDSANEKLIAEYSTHGIESKTQPYPAVIKYDSVSDTLRVCEQQNASTESGVPNTSKQKGLLPD